MSQQQTLPLVVPENNWYCAPITTKRNYDEQWFKQLDWMVYRKNHYILSLEGLSQQAQLAELEKYYIINDLDIRNIQEQEAAGNYFLMSLYVNTMVFDKDQL